VPWHTERVAQSSRDHHLRSGAASRAHSAALALALAGVALVGCGETPALCDGSDEVRWAHAEGFGGRNYAPPFLAEYGALHITIDGRCEFSLYDATLRGLRRGVINRGLAQKLERELHYGEYASFARVEVPVCLDGSDAWVADINGSVHIGCVLGGPGITQALLDTVRRLESLPRDLDAIAERVWRPVQIQIVSVLPPDLSVPPSQPIYDWNAPLDLAANALSYADYADTDLPATGIHVEDDTTLAHLDELRSIDVAADDAVLDTGGYRLVERGLWVRDAEGRVFQVLVRDEPSEAVRQAWAALAPH
jgi:hypothetical protein